MINVWHAGTPAAIGTLQWRQRWWSYHAPNTSVTLICAYRFTLMRCSVILCKILKCDKKPSTKIWILINFPLTLSTLYSIFMVYNSKMSNGIERERNLKARRRETANYYEANNISFRSITSRLFSSYFKDNWSNHKQRRGRKRRHLKAGSQHIYTCEYMSTHIQTNALVRIHATFSLLFSLNKFMLYALFIQRSDIAYKHTHTHTQADALTASVHTRRHM